MFGNLGRYGTLWRRLVLLLLIGLSLHLIVLIARSLFVHEAERTGRLFGFPFAASSLNERDAQAAIRLLEAEDEHPTEPPTHEIMSKLQAGVPLVLHWTPFFHGNHIREFIRHFPTCEHECVHTEERSFLSQARAVVFHVRHTNLSDLPPERPDQMRVMFSREGPNQSFFANGVPQQLRADFFNATITYRTTSDVFLPYGALRELDGSETAADRWSDEEIVERIARKNKMALIAVSHCDTWSKREVYVRALEEHLPITSIGRCNKNTDCLSKECLARLEEDHFFYLSFENAVCPEYVTEKFFRMSELIVPVVLSRAVMPAWIPADSFLAASDYPSARHLAEHMKQIAADPAEYKKFFAWTKRYRRAPFEFWHPENGCQLCALLHRNERRELADFKPFFDTSICSLAYGEMLAFAPRSMAYQQTVENEERKLAAFMAANERKRRVSWV